MEDNRQHSRRHFLKTCLRNTALAGLAVLTGGLFFRRRVNCGGSAEDCASCPELAGCRLSGADMLWQLDPAKCVQCGKCATTCVLEPSAVKCVHAFDMCGYCALCFGYFEPGVKALHEGAENQICPTGAITRTFIEPPYFDYIIDKTLCIGCGKCVKGCTAFGNGSMYLQVDHSICVNCNDCSIARNCPAEAFSRVPAEKPYIKKGKEGDA